MNIGNLEGLIPIFGGIYIFLIANGNLPKKPKNPEKMKSYREKYGKIMKILSVGMVGFGFLQLFGIL